MNRLTAMLCAVVVLCATAAAQDVGTRDTVRFYPSETDWATAEDSIISIEVWGWIDDPMIGACSFGFRVSVDTAGLDPDLYSVHLDTLPGNMYVWSSSVDSLIYVDTFIFDPGITAQMLVYYRSLLIAENATPYDLDWGYNGFSFGLINVFPPSPIFTPSTSTKIGDLYLGILTDSPASAPTSFTITVDSSFFPPAGAFKYSPTGGTGFVPEFTKATINVSECEFPCVDSDSDCYGDPGHPENACPEDNCPYDYNPSQVDSDSDGVGDACDVCPGYDDQADPDGDTVPDSCDNCPDLFNMSQVDTDDDEAGNVCDNCIYVYNPDQADTDGDGIGDACDQACGDVNLDFYIDIDDIIYIIDYLFRGGPPPDPLESGDINCSGDIDIDDVVMLIDYIFLGGRAPCDPDDDGIPDC